MLKLLKNKKGVTLVELLAVIIILGIIAAIAIPTIGNLIDNQKQNAAEAEWANVLEAARLYKVAEPEAQTVDLATLVSEGYITVALGDVALDDDAEYATEPEGGLLPLITALADIDFDLTGAAPVVDLPTDYTHVYVNGLIVVPAV